MKDKKEGKVSSRCQQRSRCSLSLLITAPELRGLWSLRTALACLLACSQGFESHTHDGVPCSFVFSALLSSNKRVLPWFLYLLCSQEDYSHVCPLAMPVTPDDLHLRVTKGTHSLAHPWKLGMPWSSHIFSS